MRDLQNTKGILNKMLACDYEGADCYRAQLAAAGLVRHETGCSIRVDRARTPAAPFDVKYPSKRFVEATGHGKLWSMLHVHEGYLDDLELLFSKRFPDPATIRLTPDRRRALARPQAPALPFTPPGRSRRRLDGERT